MSQSHFGIMEVIQLRKFEGVAKIAEYEKVSHHESSYKMRSLVGMGTESTGVSSAQPLQQDCFDEKCGEDDPEFPCHVFWAPVPIDSCLPYQTSHSAPFFCSTLAILRAKCR